MTRSQENIIDQINNSNEFEVVETDESEYFTSVIVESREKHFYLKKQFHLFIGKRGGIRVVSADQVLSSNENLKNITSSFGYSVFGRNLKIKGV